MKFEHSVTKFTPFTIAVENEVEAAVLYALLCHRSIVDGIEAGLRIMKENGELPDDGDAPTHYSYWFPCDDIREKIMAAFPSGIVPYHTVFSALHTAMQLTDKGE